MFSYWAIVSARFRTLLQYRVAAMAGLGTQLFWGLILTMIFEGFFRSSTASQPMELEEVVTYIWLGQAFFALLPINVERDIRDLIRTGAVSYELLRPLDLYTLWFSRVLAMRTAPTLLRSVPLVVIAGLLLNMQAPATWASAGVFVLAMLGALLLSSVITTLLNISMLWTVSGDGVAGIAPAAVLIFSGALVPVPFFPEWAQTVLEILPFRGLLDTPFRLYLGHIPPGDAVFTLAHQLAWTVGLVVVGRWVLSRGVRRLVVQGG